MPPTLDLWLRRALLLVAAAGALTAVLGGLARVGVDVAFGLRVIREHGPLFVPGVLGTVIALERAVALGRPLAFVAPGLGAAAVVALLVQAPGVPWLVASSALALVALNAAIVRRQSAPFTWLMLLGSVVLAAGDLAWALGQPVFQVVSTWMAFLVLTIVAERLELSRLSPTPRWAGRALVGACVLFALGACAAALGVAGAPRALGVLMALLGAWQLRFDLARRTLRQPGLPRFCAAGVLAGAAWLVLTGSLLAVRGLPSGGDLYDAVLHGVFVGYVLSMIFAHAPIILPAVARVHVPFSPVLYVPLAVLHLGLAARIAGDLLPSPPVREVGAIGNAVALVLFVLAVLFARFAAPVTPRRT